MGAPMLKLAALCALHLLLLALLLGQVQSDNTFTPMCPTSNECFLKLDPDFRSSVTSTTHWYSSRHRIVCPSVPEAYLKARVMCFGFMRLLVRCTVFGQPFDLLPNMDPGLYGLNMCLTLKPQSFTEIDSMGVAVLQPWDRTKDRLLCTQYEVAEQKTTKESMPAALRRFREVAPGKVRMVKSVPFENFKEAVNNLLVSIGAMRSDNLLDGYRNDAHLTLETRFCGTLKVVPLTNKNAVSESSGSTSATAAPWELVDTRTPKWAKIGRRAAAAAN